MYIHKQYTQGIYAFVSKTLYMYRVYIYIYTYTHEYTPSLQCRSLLMKTCVKPAQMCANRCVYSNVCKYHSLKENGDARAYYCRCDCVKLKPSVYVCKWCEIYPAPVCVSPSLNMHSYLRLCIYIHTYIYIYIYRHMYMYAYMYTYTYIYIYICIYICLPILTHTCVLYVYTGTLIIYGFIIRVCRGLHICSTHYSVNVNVYSCVINYGVYTQYTGIFQCKRAYT